MPEPLFRSDLEARGLSAEELDRFERLGWVGSYPLLTESGVLRCCVLRDLAVACCTGPNELAQATDPQAFERRPWFKSLHAMVPEYYDVASHPVIVSRVASILGSDVIAWGLTLTRSGPGAVHRWHVDVEHLRWPGVSIYIGLVNSSLASTLKVLNGSQQMHERPQAYGVRDDAAALAAVRPTVPETDIVRVPVAPGEFFLFAGQLWHGSHNIGDDARIAMIIHYSRPDVQVQIPLGFNEPIQWHGYRPPCILVSGTDQHGINRLIPRPGPLPSY
ncbi:MAG TPA: phytanoyl-CoA dioxygenase family protein [Gammaproteobacteria bacterium]